VGTEWGVKCVAAVSNTTGNGFDAFTDALAAELDRRYNPTRGGAAIGEGEAALVTNARHRQHLQACAVALEACLGTMDRRMQ